MSKLAASEGGNVMTKKKAILNALLAAALPWAATVYAQDLTITNARILDGNGTVIERGAVVVRDGRIAAVTEGAPSASAGRTIDVDGG